MNVRFLKMVNFGQVAQVMTCGAKSVEMGRNFFSRKPMYLGFLDSVPPPESSKVHLSGIGALSENAKKWKNGPFFVSLTKTPRTLQLQEIRNRFWYRCKAWISI